MIDSQVFTKHCISMLQKFWCTWGSAGGLLKHRLPGLSHPEFGSAGLRSGRGICISQEVLMLLVRGLTLRSTAVYPISLTSKMSRASSRVPERTERLRRVRCSGVMLEYHQWWGNCTHSVQWYLTSSAEPALWLPEQTLSYMQLQDIKCGADVDDPCLQLCCVSSAALLLHVLMGGSWFPARCLKWSFAFVEVGHPAGTLKGAWIHVTWGVNYGLKGLWELPRDGSKR